MGECRRAPASFPFPGRGTGGVQKHRGCMCTHAHSHGQLHSRRRVAPKIPCVAWRCACAAVARVARCVHAMAPALRAHAWPRCRVLAGHRERVRVQLRVARVQCVLCKVCAHEQCWQHCAPHGVRHACVLDEAHSTSEHHSVRARARMFAGSAVTAWPGSECWCEVLLLGWHVRYFFLFVAYVLLRKVIRVLM